MSESEIIAYNLPPQVTPFVGRHDELAEIARLVADPTCRLLTLTGPGGIGKTRLAREAARSVVDSPRPEGEGSGVRVYFVPLQALTSPDFIVATIADTLNFTFYGQQDPKQQLLDYLRDNHLLLVLDNFEHLLDGVGLLPEILEHAPNIKLFVTSRERLNLREEWVLDIGGLNYPVSEAETNIEDYAAVELFAQHAQRVNARFALQNANKRSIVRICHLVGGMPLGIELAAAWVRALSCDQIAGEIERSLDILETSTRNVEPRHRTMRAALVPTWNRLSEDERAIFMKLSVFRGGFTWEAAEYVAGASLRTLSALVDKSLLRVDVHGRYDLHELLRQYGEEQLSVLPDENQQTHDLHCTYYAEFMRQQWAHLRSHRQKEAMREIETEIDNVQLAWRWAVQYHKADQIEKFLESLWFFYDARCWFDLGEREVRAAADMLLGKQNEHLRGKVLARLSHFCRSQGHLEQARTFIEESVAILRRLGVREDMPFVLVQLGGVVGKYGDPWREKQLLEEALTISREVGDRWTASNILFWLGLHEKFRDNYEEATRLCQEGLAIAREIGSPGGTANSLGVIGECAYLIGAFGEAKQLFQEHLVSVREADNVYDMMHAPLGLGLAQLALGECPQALVNLYDSLTRAIPIGVEKVPGIPVVLVEIAPLLADRSEKSQALTYLSLALHQTTWNLPPPVKDRALQLLARLEAEMPSDVFDDAVERGKSLDLRTAVERLLAQIDAILHEPSPDRNGAGQLLTERELEILRLVAAGLSNQEIADQLILALGTVKWYMSEILSKMHVANRTQAVARARELGLLTT